MTAARRTIKLTDEHWQSLIDIAAGLVLDGELAERTKPGYSRIAPMLRMIAEGRLIVTRPEKEMLKT